MIPLNFLFRPSPLFVSAVAIASPLSVAECSCCYVAFTLMLSCGTGVIISTSMTVSMVVRFIVLIVATTVTFLTTTYAFVVVPIMKIIGCSQSCLQCLHLLESNLNLFFDACWRDNDVCNFFCLRCCCRCDGSDGM